MSANPVFVQALADATQRPVEVSPVLEATTLGAGFLAGLAIGTWASWDDLAATWPPRARVEPGAADRPRPLARRGRAVRRVVLGPLVARLLTGDRPPGPSHPGFGPDPSACISPASWSDRTTRWAERSRAPGSGPVRLRHVLSGQP